MTDLSELALIVDLVLAVAAAFIGGAIAHRLGQPTIIGYLLAGIVVGPFTPGPITDIHRIQVLAEMGIAFLMFALGVEFSLARLRQVRDVAVFGGLAQIALTVVLGYLIGPLLGLTSFQSVFFGAIIAISSTVVAIKVLMSRGEIDSLHGRTAVGILIIQDLSVVPIVIILPALAQAQGDLWIPLAVALAKAIGILVVAYFLGTKLIPLLLFRVAATRSRELFLLMIITLALGTAISTYAVGLSLAFGAFLAGLLVSESELSHQVIAEVLPLRDIFATLFFVAVGMLINPLFLWEFAPIILWVTVVVLVGKFLIAAAITLAFGYPSKAAVMTGLTLLQIGEFSFILAKLGVDRGIIPDRLYSLTLAVAVLTILVSPLALRLGSGLQGLLQHLPYLGRYLQEQITPYPEGAGQHLSNHVVICGYGRVGRELAAALSQRGFRFLIVEYNPHVVADLRRNKVPCVYGDAANPVVLAHAGLLRAKAMAVTIPDLGAAEVTVRNALQIQPKLDIIARGNPAGLSKLMGAGARECVHPEFEAGLEFIRHIMRRFGVSSTEILAMNSRRRSDHYSQAQPERLGE